jgi:hypothetical protein
MGFQQRNTAQQIAKWLRTPDAAIKIIDGEPRTMYDVTQVIALLIEEGEWCNLPAPACGKHCTTGGRPTGFRCVLPVGHDGLHRHELGGTYP